MDQERRGPRFALEPARAAGREARERLDGDVARQGEVPRLVDDAHPAGSDPPPEAVLAGEEHLEGDLAQLLADREETDERARRALERDEDAGPRRFQPVAVELGQPAPDVVAVVRLDTERPGPLLRHLDDGRGGVEGEPRLARRRERSIGLRSHEERDLLDAEDPLDAGREQVGEIGGVADLAHLLGDPGERVGGRAAGAEEESREEGADLLAIPGAGHGCGEGEAEEERLVGEDLSERGRTPAVEEHAERRHRRAHRVGEDRRDREQRKEEGFPRKLSTAESKACRLALDDAYIDRFTRIFPGLDPTARAHLEGFAQVLGTLTYACLENEKNGTCGWKKKASPVLGKEHILVARELLGFYIRLPENKRCDPATYKVLQIDEPCPLCPSP